jgi:hypothetical protein
MRLPDLAIAFVALGIGVALAFSRPPTEGDSIRFIGLLAASFCQPFLLLRDAIARNLRQQ